VGALGVDDPQSRIREAAGSDDMLLQQLSFGDVLHEVSGSGPEGIKTGNKALTYQVVHVCMKLICCLFPLLILAMLLLPKDLAVALITCIYCLHQSVNRCNEVGQQRMAFGRS
jgi:hypothetical protein